tara:strand:- start:1167 stop:1610 length:444 start_codon:yes stop_codon:yes gene_type:complete
MDIAQLKGAVLERYQSLTDDEMALVQTIQETDIGQALLKVFQPVLDEMFSEPEDETERMLSERTVGEPPNILPPDEDIPDLAKDMPEEFRESPTLVDRPQRDTMPQEFEEFGRGDGRSQGGNKLPPMRARDPSLLQDRKGEREMVSR